MMKTRKEWVEALRHAAQRIADNAEDIFPSIERTTQVTVTLTFRPDEMTGIEITRCMNDHPMMLDPSPRMLDCKYVPGDRECDDCIKICPYA